MLRNTFIHLPGVGAHRERVLWKQGILDWDRFLEAAEDGSLRQGVYQSAVPLVRQSLDAAAAGDANFFNGRLPSRETWRLYPEFADRALFLDIETTGLSAHYDEVTLIGALGNGKLALFVKGTWLCEHRDSCGNVAPPRRLVVKEATVENPHAGPDRRQWPNQRPATRPVKAQTCRQLDPCPGVWRRSPQSGSSFQPFQTLCRRGRCL
jgi:hypothetical protein